MLELVPIVFSEACEFVSKHHRHHKKPVGHKFSIAAAIDGVIVGVVMVGRPVGRHDDNGWTLEVNRLCTTGEKNACSFLYRAAWRVAKNLGYKRLITFILNTENGASLRASGFTLIGEAGGKSWSVKSRPRVDKSPQQLKMRYELTNKQNQGK